MTNSIITIIPYIFIGVFNNLIFPLYRGYKIRKLGWVVIITQTIIIIIFNMVISFFTAWSLTELKFENYFLLVAFLPSFIFFKKEKYLLGILYLKIIEIIFAIYAGIQYGHLIS